jgi:hypothetical protein
VEPTTQQKRNPAIDGRITFPTNPFRSLVPFTIPKMIQLYGWLKKKRELSEKVLSNFIKFL